MELEIGKNYGGCFGIDSSKGGKAIFKGDDNWEMTNYEGVTQVMNNPKATQAVIAYHKKNPTVSIGRQLG